MSSNNTSTNFNYKENSKDIVDKNIPIIEVVDAKKVYKVGQERVQALDGVSFTINKGDFCCLLGSSGSREINIT